MKNLILNDFGVQEMNAEEMRKTDGGFIPLLIIVAVALVTSSCATSRYVVEGDQPGDGKDTTKVK